MTECARIEQWSQETENLNVLFVDDEQNVLHALQRVLRREPYHVVTSDSPIKVLETIKNGEFQMIVSDQRMPEMNGIEFLQKAMELAPEAIRIMLTGYSDLKTAEDAINQVEIYRFLCKPWNDEDLRATILQGLAKWQLKRANQTMLKIIEEQNLKLQEFNRDLEKKVEQRTRQLKEAGALLMQSEKMSTVGLLAGGIAHEINNPLGGILAVTQLLEMELSENAPALQDLKTIEQAVFQCKNIIQNLLGFSRNDRHREPTRLSEVVEKSLGLVGFIFRESRIKVVESYDPDMPMVTGNPNQLQQVIINILTNAQQAMNKQGTVFIRGYKGLDGGAVLEIEDQGEGIAEKIREKIFDPFFTTKEKDKGTGLGLFVTYGIMRDHRGKIEVLSEPGKGACMRLRFEAQN